MRTSAVYADSTASEVMALVSAALLATPFDLASAVVHNHWRRWMWGGVDSVDGVGFADSVGVGGGVSDAGEYHHLCLRW